MSNSKNNVTLIDDLPDLEDLDNEKSEGLRMIPNEQVNRLQKFIRNSSYKTPFESGMDTTRIPGNYPQFPPYNPNSQSAPPYNPRNNPRNNFRNDNLQNMNHIQQMQKIQQIQQMQQQQNYNTNNFNNNDMNDYDDDYDNDYDNHYDTLRKIKKRRKNYNADIDEDKYIKGYPEYADKPEENVKIESYEKPKDKNITCVDVANHASSCNVCSRLYNNDKTIFIIAIVLLSIICIILLKKVLEI
jgi:hypothetical protein